MNAADLGENCISCQVIFVNLKSKKKTKRLRGKKITVE